MGSDKARVSYNPSRQYRSVVMQQGRVTLEADWNEAQQITSEQTRLEALDFVGPTGTPDNGYAISLINSSFDFQIGPGIMYVGGMRASLPTGLNYSQQPQNDWMDAANDPAWVPVPNAAPTGNEYVYLFLREQEISAIEDADLRDVALGGPDTAQRTRLVQHVVRLATTGNNCPTAFAAAQTTWAGEGFTLNPDSSVSSFAQLQVSFVPPSTPATPCDPTAKSGYLGADNQLIRVQVSDSKASPQCLLWGYNDASFLYGVTVTSATSVTLQSAPIDAEHIPQSGQVVEILMPAAQLANGQYAAAPSGQIFTLGASAYDPDTQILTLPNSLTDSLYGDGTSKNPSPPQLFLRVWQGSLPITPGTAQTLPNTGIQVTLTSTNANHVFRAGDYWTFAVRPAFPTLVYPGRYAQNPQPPEGPREWICPLAVLLWTSTPPTAPSCRNPFDNLVELTAGDQGGCCSVYVTAAGHNQGTFTLQEAVSQVLSTGGRICLGPGTFNLTSTVEITGATLAIEIGGMGSSALFSTSPGVTTLALAAPPTPQTAAVPAILISGCQGVTIQDLNLTFAPGYTAQINNATGGQTTAYPNPGIMIQNSDSVTIQRCTLSCSGNQLPTNPAIAIAGLVREITIENNIIQFTLSANPAVPALGAGFGITNLPPIGDTQGGVSCLTFDLWINDNVLANVSFGIELDATCYHLGQVGISGNLIGPSGNAILVAGSGLPPLFTSVDISRNQVVESFSGIACGLAARICDNDLTLLPVATPAAGDAAIGGIVITAPVLSSDQIDGLQITGNRITGGSGFGILIEAPLGSAAIANNVLEGVACGGIYAMAGANHLSITNNQLINLVPNSNDPGVGAMAGAYGILLAPATTNGSAVQAGYVEILGNLIQNFATDATQTTVGSTPRYAIALQGYTSTVISDNHLINLGPTSHATDTSAGIYASAYPFDRIDISRNVIRLNDSTTADLTSSTWYGVYLSGFVRERIKVETGANLLNEKIIPTFDTQFVAVSQLGGKLVNAGGLQNVSLGGNFIEGAGRLSPVQIDVGGSCLFTSNQCSLTTRGNDEAIPIASLTATGVVASNNILLSAGKETAGLVITTTSTLKPQNFTVLGNITTGTIAVNGAGLSATLAALNVVE